MSNKNSVNEQEKKSSKNKSIKEWIKRNKRPIIVIGSIAVATTGAVVIAVLLNDKAMLKKEIEQLQLDNLMKEIEKQELVELCERKDTVMNSVISEGLRYGSPLAAQQMAFKKYLKTIAVN